MEGIKQKNILSLGGGRVSVINKNVDMAEVGSGDGWGCGVSCVILKNILSRGGGCPLGSKKFV